MKTNTTNEETSEAALKAGKQRHAATKTLQEHDAILAERQLHDSFQKSLSVDEEFRRTMGLYLQDVIAQTFLGIHVRVLALKKLATVRSPSLAQEITNIQWVVQESTDITNRLSYEFAV